MRFRVLGIVATVSLVIVAVAAAQTGGGNPLVALAQQLIQLAARVSDLEAQPSSAGFVVVDGAGEVFGPVVGVSDGLQVAQVTVEHSDGRRLAFRVWRDKFEGGAASEGFVEFKSADCTGQPYIHEAGAGSSSRLIFPLTTVSAPGFTVYLQSGPRESITARSLLWSVSGVCDNSYGAGQTFNDVVPAEIVSTWSHLVAPFTVQSR